MAFRKSSSGCPEIVEVSPQAAIPGGEVQIRGRGLAGPERPEVRFGESQASIVIGSDSYLVVRVPEGATGGELFLGANGGAAWACQIGVQVADGVHPVSNPVVDRRGAIYTTLSGSAGQKTPVSVFKIEPGGSAKPLVADMMNATGLALDASQTLYVSSRHDGVVYQISASGSRVPYVEGMGVATGIVFDPEDNLYVGDRSGTIFKISRQRQIYVFATMEPSLAAYHLAFGPDGFLYVTGPTTSTFDSIARISKEGRVERFYRGLGRPQGLAFDVKGNLYVAASLSGRRGVVRITPGGSAELFLSGPSIVGLAFTPSKSLILATHNALYRADVGIEGRRIP
ncbi:MAG TPA: IPT/TIG domain-containing protein [Bryobacteraceae bacterium]|nr:IPT/TIG domain-containing protein [Bryobacteraceae bacterium]